MQILRLGVVSRKFTVPAAKFWYKALEPNSIPIIIRGFGTIVGLLKDRACVEDEPDRRLSIEK